jgi:hypothetical protein
MPRRKSITNDEIRQALAASFGLQSAAAHTLGISPATLARRLKANPNLGLSDADIRESHYDRVVMSIANRAMAGDLAACIWWARNQMGWTTPDERPPSTPRRIPLDPDRTFKLIQDREQAPAATDEPSAAPLEKRKTRSGARAARSACP